MLARVRAFVRLGRFHFLGAGSLLYLLGALIARYRAADWNGRAFGWGLLAVALTQLVTHFGNEYFDLAADRANRTPTRFSGGSRVLVEGRLPARVALATSLVCAGAALAVGLYIAFALRPGWLLLPLLWAGLLLTWSYSGPPLRLHYRGLGEALVSIGLPIVPLVGFYMQAGRVAALPILASLPLAALQWAMILSIEFSDEQGDAAAGKRTVIVLLGARRAAQWHNAGIIAAYLLLPLLALADAPLLAIGALAIWWPLAAWQVGRFRCGEWALPERWNSLELGDIALLGGSVVSEIAAFAWLAGV
jgi:1,4-dihydroxy-2-naphthoate octaprenyltransferase